jgi:hypothetical protein
VSIAHSFGSVPGGGDAETLGEPIAVATGSADGGAALGPVRATKDEDAAGRCTGCALRKSESKDELGLVPEVCIASQL